MIFSDILFQLSVRSVKLNFLRSVLAAVGIVIGVIAIASMGMMGTNMTLSVTKQLSATSNTISVSPYTGGGSRGLGGGGAVSTSTYLTKFQFQDIQRAAGQNYVYYVYQTSNTTKVGSTQGRAAIYGMAPADMKKVLRVANGSYPQNDNSVLVGPTYAEQNGIVLGSRIKIGNVTGGTAVTVRVAGILEARGFTMDISSDRAIVATDRWFYGTYGGEDHYSKAVVVLNDISDLSSVEADINKQLNRRTNVVSIDDSTQMLKTITSTLGTLTTFVMAIAGISLMVAAVAIFNVMMMSVSERTREIGILRSIGTQKGEIRRMFLYESSILGLIGAGIGAVLSLFIGYLVVLIMVGNTDYFFTPESLVYVPEAMLIGIVICLVSGVYPAWRASNLDPIEALRAE